MPFGAITYDGAFGFTRREEVRIRTDVRYSRKTIDGVETALAGNRTAGAHDDLEGLARADPSRTHSTRIDLRLLLNISRHEIVVQQFVVILDHGADDVRRRGGEAHLRVVIHASEHTRVD